MIVMMRVTHKNKPCNAARITAKHRSAVTFQHTPITRLWVPSAILIEEEKVRKNREITLKQQTVQRLADGLLCGAGVGQSAG
ncbi:hypothetical protein C4F51_00930 [Cellvibrio sp. KB43]|uniref:Uncharacterized protein n=1 Tax=Cellvibrio polysaccharolyticus TaxID=2082724 RepID=A0A928UZ66_9GAMM|nr:hypothetical protein [Cellvibrio polysaccharolyticus]